jgi:polyphenol oxidase
MASRQVIPDSDKPSAVELARLSRRAVFAATGAAAGSLALGGFPPSGSAWADHGAAGKSTTTPYPFGSDPTRTRKNFYDWSDDEVLLFSRAVSALRDAPSIHDPLQWDNIVSAHAEHCTEPVPIAGPNQVHWSWFFLPWHRAYLFFIERHIANAIVTLLRPKGTQQQADNFALPYWDWVTHKAMPNTKIREARGELSPFFGIDLKTNFDPNGGGDPNPDNLGLYDGYRGPTTRTSAMDPATEDLAGWREYVRLIRDRYTSPDEISELFKFSFCKFAGRPTIDAGTGQGALENEPHNMIHDWVGSRFGDNRDMGNLRYAALDPIFNLHHANIDWIWSRYPKTPDPNHLQAETNCAAISDFEAWLAKEYTFLDIDGKMKSVTVKDTLTNMSNINYSPPASAPALVAVRADRHPQERSAIVSEQKTRLSDKPETFKPAAKAMLTADGNDVRAGTPGAAALEIEVGDFYYARRFQVRIFANKTDADKETPYSDEHFVGLFQALNSHAGGRTGGTHAFVVNVSPKTSTFFKVAPPGKPFTLTLVPIGTSSEGKPFFLDVKKITLSVFD